MTNDTSNFIQQNASFDSVLRYRLSGVIGDLIAIEGKYHLPCYSALKKRFEHNKKAKQFDTVSEDAITRFKRHGHVVPRKFESKQMPGYIRFAIDNIGINEETLSGKGAFHASQTAAFLTPTDETPEEEVKIERGTLRSIQVPDYFLSLKESDIGTAKPEPVFVSEVTTGILTKDHDMAVYADIKDIAWFLCRNNQKIPMSSGFNQQITTERAPQTEIGHLPIINFPTHEYDTIWTVILISHSSKAMLKVILNRLKPQAEEIIAEE